MVEVFFGVKLYLGSKSETDANGEAGSSEVQEEETTVRKKKPSRSSGQPDGESPDSIGETDIEDDINPTGAFEKKEQSYCFAYVSTESSNLNVRADADQNSAKIGSLSKSQVVLVNTPYGWGYGWEDEPSWVSIEYYDDGYTPKYGWVQNSYLTKCDKKQNFYFGEFGYGDRFVGEGKNKSRADEMMKILSDFSKSHPDVIGLGEYQYIGMFGSNEGDMGYIYNDLNGFFSAGDDGYYEFRVYPSDNEIIIGHYEGLTFITFKNNKIVKIAYQYDEGPQVFWEAQK